MDGAILQSPRLRDDRLRRLRDVRRRLHDGGNQQRGGVAGRHLKLSNLCWIYDNNKITIEGHTDWAFSDDVATRFIAYGWNVTRVGDANDQAMLARAFHTFKATNDRPTLIIVDSHIAYGAPNKQDTSAAHGEPLGEQEIRLTKRNYGWPEDAKFLVPNGVYERFQELMGQRGPRITRGTIFILAFASMPWVPS
jgi:transketolase